MIGDVSRTGTYRKAILGNGAAAIRDKVVLDVGAGTSSLRSALTCNRFRYLVLHGGSGRRGGRHRPRSVEHGGEDTDRLCPWNTVANLQLIDQANKGEANPHLRNRVRVVKGMVEDKKVQDDVMKTGKVDTIISEPIGVMLLHERMVGSTGYYC